jgi:hypothetical protein
MYPGVHRAWHPPDASRRRHRAPDRRLDSAAGPQPGDRLDERFEDIRFLIRDRGSNFTRSFDAVFQATGGHDPVHRHPCSPNERYLRALIRTLRHELLDRMLIVGERHLRAILTEYQMHYNAARPHQGIAQRVPDSQHRPSYVTVAELDARQIRRKPVLSGLINEYMRAA